MNICIIGKSGQLANELMSTIPTSFNVTTLGRNCVDILSKESISNKLNEISPSVVINASAYTAVDKAESECDKAYDLNHHAVENLAYISKVIGARFIHVSTDFVFSGVNNKPYCVDDKPEPQSVYGASKLAGEQSVLAVYPENSTIVRTSWVYSSFGNNFVKTMLKLMSEKDELAIVGDQIGRPTYAKELARFLWCLCSEERLKNIYHWSDEGITSWYDFAKSIQELAFNRGLLVKKIPVKSIPAISYPTPAVRPIFSVLEIADSKEVIEPCYWRENLSKCLENIDYSKRS